MEGTKNLLRLSIPQNPDGLGEMVTDMHLVPDSIFLLAQ